MTVWESANKLIKKKVLKSGNFSSSKPTELAICTIHVRNPTSLNLSYKQIKDDLHSDIVEEDEKKVIVIGDACSDTDRYLEIAIQTMFHNEQSLITVQIPDHSSKDKEPAVLSLEVTLEDVKLYKPIWEWNAEEKYKTALKYKEKGVELFKINRQIDAFHKFSKACKILITMEPLEMDSVDDERKQLFKNISDLKLTLYNNMAECQLVRKNYEHVLTLCSKVLDKEENNVKALYRRGVAHGSLKDYEKAIVDLKIVISLIPDDKRAREKFNFYNEKWCASVQNYENMIRKMFKA